MAVGSAQRLDQAGAWISTVQRSGVEKVQGEWDLVCLALNAKRMLGLQMG